MPTRERNAPQTDPQQERRPGLDSSLNTGEQLPASIIRRIASAWQIEQNRSRFLDDGFDWWPGHFCVCLRVTTEEHRQDVRVSICTDFLTDVPATEQRFVELAAMHSVMATSTYAWVYPPTAYWHRLYGEQTKEVPRLQFSSTAYVTDETASWLTDFLAGTAIVQPINAEIQAKNAPEFLAGGKPDVSGPLLTADLGLDEMLETLALAYGPVGQQPSRWAGSTEFEEFAEEWGRSDICFGTGDATGLTLETPMGSDSILMRLETSERHPQLGHGLLGTIQVPYFQVEAEISGLSAELNFLEHLQWTGFPQNGCWHPVRGSDDRFGLAFTSFVPNALFRPGIATSLAMWLLLRSRWLHDQKWPELKDLAMSEIITKRALLCP